MISTSDNSNIYEVMLELKKALREMELENISLKAESLELHQKINQLIKTQENFEQNCQHAFHRLELCINSIGFPGLKLKIKKFLRPRLGQLYQYNEARPMTIPKHYEKPLSIKNPPSISIVTPSFNQATYLEKTITSVLSQQYPNLEYIIQDGGSQDHSLAIIQQYAPSLKHWESQPDTGQSNALNLGFQHATGEIMAYLNSDDLLLPGSLAYIARFFNQHPEIDVIYGHRILVDKDDQEIGRWILPPHNAKALTWADYIPQETLFWRRRIWDKAGGKIDESFKFAMDWDLILRFQDAGARFARLPRFLGIFRVHSHQKTLAHMRSQGEKEMERLRRRYHSPISHPREINKKIRWFLIQHIILHKLYRLKLLRY